MKWYKWYTYFTDNLIKILWLILLVKWLVSDGSLVK
jgi:hypothetical protein